MNCPYCHASNVAEEHRCQRCGRRLDATNADMRQPYGRTATARALHYETQDQPEQQLETPRPDTARRSTPLQPSLFQTRVVSFESYAPEAVEESKPRARAASPSRPRHKRTLPGQESFHFETYDTIITQPAPPHRAADPIIGYGGYAAQPVHRLMAAAFDLSMVIIAAALFMLVFYLAGGEFVLNAHTAALCGGLTAVFYLLYELLWCWADTDTAGMTWAHLKVVDFDGGEPTRDQRLFRVAAGGLSVLAACLGILWALVDEESLTWHDHISKTFPTPF